jgi:hypothetical protein
MDGLARQAEDGAGAAGGGAMIMAWFFPLGVLVGLAGTQTAYRSRHTLRLSRQEGTWWFLVLLAWLPILCWIAAQFVVQD